MKKNVLILNVASKLFLDQGYHEISMDMVAKVAGVSKATVYAHFESKEHLFLSVIKKEQEKSTMIYPEIDLIPVVCGKINEETMRAVLRQYLIQCFDYYSNEDVIRVFRILITDASRFPHLFVILRKHFFLQITSKLEDFLIDYYEKKGLSNKAGVRVVAHDIIDMLRGKSLWATLVQDSMKMEFLNNKEKTVDEVLRSSMLLINNFEERNRI